jgi:iron complex transport system ATP-binding protein
VIGAERLSVMLQNRMVLQGVGLRVAAGELVALCGPNGAGKTTLLRALAGLLPPAAGHVVRPPARRMAYVAQAERCAWGLTLAQVVALGRLPHGDADAAAVAGALAAFDLGDLAGARVDRVSGGQARRALLARAFATRPDVLLLDEPVADLDPWWQHAVLARLRQAARDGAAVVAVLHAVELAAAFADRLVVLAGGRVTADGPPARILPAAAEAFGMALDQGVRLVRPPD